MKAIGSAAELHAHAIAIEREATDPAQRAPDPFVDWESVYENR